MQKIQDYVNACNVGGPCISTVEKNDGVVSSLCGNTFGVSLETSSEKKKLFY